MQEWYKKDIKVLTDSEKKEVLKKIENIKDIYKEMFYTPFGINGDIGIRKNNKEFSKTLIDNLIKQLEIIKQDDILNIEFSRNFCFDAYSEIFNIMEENIKNDSYIKSQYNDNIVEYLYENMYNLPLIAIAENLYEKKNDADKYQLDLLFRNGEFSDNKFKLKLEKLFNNLECINGLNLLEYLGIDRNSKNFRYRKAVKKLDRFIFNNNQNM
jgi:hypothetical protein